MFSPRVPERGNSDALAHHSSIRVPAEPCRLGKPLRGCGVFFLSSMVVVVRYGCLSSVLFRFVEGKLEHAFSADQPSDESRICQAPLNHQSAPPAPSAKYSLGSTVVTVRDSLVPIFENELTTVDTAKGFRSRMIGRRAQYQHHEHGEHSLIADRRRPRLGGHRKEA